MPPTIQTDALFFSPRYGGFNMDSLKISKNLGEYNGPGSIDNFNKEIYGAYKNYHRKAGDGFNPLKLDDWLQYHREDYLHPKGYNSAEQRSTL
jgi:hypothetical protein